VVRLELVAEHHPEATPRLRAEGGDEVSGLGHRAHGVDRRPPSDQVAAQRKVEAWVGERACGGGCPSSPGWRLQHRLQPARHFPIAIDWDEVYAVECLRRSNPLDEVTRNRHSGISVGIKSANDRFRYGQLGHFG